MEKETKRNDECKYLALVLAVGELGSPYIYMGAQVCTVDIDVDKMLVAAATKGNMTLDQFKVFFNPTVAVVDPNVFQPCTKDFDKVLDKAGKSG